MLSTDISYYWINSSNKNWEYLTFRPPCLLSPQRFKWTWSNLFALYYSCVKKSVTPCKYDNLFFSIDFRFPAPGFPFWMSDRAPSIKMGYCRHQACAPIKHKLSTDLRGQWLSWLERLQGVSVTNMKVNPRSWFKSGVGGGLRVCVLWR